LGGSGFNVDSAAAAIMAPTRMPAIDNMRLYLRFITHFPENWLATAHFEGF
jgi:hypothetical protein